MARGTHSWVWLRCNKVSTLLGEGHGSLNDAAMYKRWFQNILPKFGDLIIHIHPEISIRDRNINISIDSHLSVLSSVSGVPNSRISHIFTSECDCIGTYWSYIMLNFSRLLLFVKVISTIHVGATAVTCVTFFHQTFRASTYLYFVSVYAAPPSLSDSFYRYFRKFSMPRKKKGSTNVFACTTVP